jgi:hypothetical protein
LRPGRIGPVCEFATAYQRVCARCATGGALVGDDLAQVVDVVFGEGGYGILADAMDPKAAVFREHVDRRLVQPVFVLAELVGDMPIVKTWAMAAKVRPPDFAIRLMKAAGPKIMLSVLKRIFSAPLTRTIVSARSRSKSVSIHGPVPAGRDLRHDPAPRIDAHPLVPSARIKVFEQYSFVDLSPWT